MVVNIANKKIIWIVLLAYLLPFVFAQNAFFPSSNINMDNYNITNASTIFSDNFVPSTAINLDGTYNITNGTFIFADAFCYNNGTCISSIINTITSAAGNTVWPISLTMAFLGGALIFGLIGWSLKSENESRIWWHEGFRFIFYAMALAMVMQAGSVQTQIVSEASVSNLLLDNALQNAALWPYRIFFFFIFVVMVIFLIIALMKLWPLFDRIRGKRGGDPLGSYESK
jgi:hypothetical protein